MLKSGKFSLSAGSQIWLHVRIAWELLKTTDVCPPSQDSDLISLGHNWDIGVLKNSLGDSNIQSGWELLIQRAEHEAAVDQPS